VPPLLVVALLGAVVLGPWLARVAVRLAARDTAPPGPVRVVVMTVLLAALLAGAVLLSGPRPATGALA
jgi:leader peptidase (prepilin peptidase)/N-methyltransferase